MFERLLCVMQAERLWHRGVACTRITISARGALRERGRLGTGVQFPSAIKNRLPLPPSLPPSLSLDPNYLAQFGSLKSMSSCITHFS